MSTVLIIAAVLLFLFFLFARFFPGKNLDAVLLEEGEEPVFDEDNVTVTEDPSRGETALYPRSRISVTDRRIVISQLPLLSRKHTIIIILYFADRERPEKTGLEGRVKTGVLHREAVEVKSDKKGEHLILRPVGYALFDRDGTELRIRTGRAGELLSAVQGL